MIKFSEKNQSFYDMALNYLDLPDDLVDVFNKQQHMELLAVINKGHYVFSDFTYSEKRPSLTHVWKDGEWVDSYTQEQKYEMYLKSLKPLTRRQFMLILIEYELDEKIESVINSIENTMQRKIIRTEFKESTTFERLSSSVIYICDLLNLNDEQVNSMWEAALLL